MSVKDQLTAARTTLTTINAELTYVDTQLARDTDTSDVDK